MIEQGCLAHRNGETDRRRGGGQGRKRAPRPPSGVYPPGGLPLHTVAKSFQKESGNQVFTMGAYEGHFT